MLGRNIAPKTALAYYDLRLKKSAVKTTALHEQLVDILEDLLHSELLALLTGEVEDRILADFQYLLATHKREDALLLLVEASGFGLGQKRPHGTGVLWDQRISTAIELHLHLLHFEHELLVVFQVDLRKCLPICIAHLHVDLCWANTLPT